MIHVSNFSNGALNPVLSYVVSCVGCFLGLRCTTRARAYQGAARARWLTLAALSIGTTGIWVMHFIAMLGFTIPGEPIRYDVPITILSMVIAVAVVGVGTFIVGFGRAGTRPLLLGGTIIGLGVASMHYIGMDAVRVDASLSYNPGLVAASVIIAVIAGTAALWMALRLDSVWSTFVASLIAGMAVNGMHYTGMAAVHAQAAAPGLVVSTADTASASGFLLPLVIGLGSIGFIFSAVIALSPTAAEIVEENALMQRIGQSQLAQSQLAQSQAARYESQARPATAGQQAWRDQGHANGNGNGQGYSNGQGHPNGQPNGQRQPGAEEPGSLFRPRRPSTPGDQPLSRSAPRWRRQRRTLRVSQEQRGRVVRRKELTRSRAWALSSQAPAGHCCQAVIPL
jgi:NO-binding membrane sensor protein with MHYT domain